MTRLQARRERSEAIPLPPNPAEYLTEWLIEIGPSIGDRPIGYADLAAWQAISGIELEPWEARALRRLSGEYLGQSARARKPDCPPPWSGGIERDKVAAQFAAMMRAVTGRASASITQSRTQRTSREQGLA